MFYQTHCDLSSCRCIQSQWIMHLIDVTGESRTRCIEIKCGTSVLFQGCDLVLCDLSLSPCIMEMFGQLKTPLGSSLAAMNGETQNISAVLEQSSACTAVKNLLLPWDPLKLMKVHCKEIWLTFCEHSFFMVHISS